MAKPISVGKDGVIFINFLKGFGKFLYRLLSKR
jgi:hypothetical protein